MAQLKQLLRITTEMIAVLNKYEKEEIDRTTTIETMTNLIDQRDKVITLVKPPYSDEEMKIGKHVIKMNEEIAEKMQHLYQLVKKDMNQVKQQKAMKKSYINPYGNFRTADGMYVDSKK